MREIGQGVDETWGDKQQPAAGTIGRTGAGEGSRALGYSLTPLQGCHAEAAASCCCTPREMSHLQAARGANHSSKENRSRAKGYGELISWNR
jgi:hypothetical protein